MPLTFKENARSLATFFIVSSLIGFLASLFEWGMLANVSREADGLSTAGQVYQLLITVSMGISLFLLCSGLFFKHFAMSAPSLVIYALGTTIAVRLIVIVILMSPITVIFGGVGIAISVYLLVQYRRVSQELSGTTQEAAEVSP